MTLRQPGYGGANSSECGDSGQMRRRPASIFDLRSSLMPRILGDEDTYPDYVTVGLQTVKKGGHRAVPPSPPTINGPSKPTLYKPPHMRIGPNPAHPHSTRRTQYPTTTEHTHPST
ncbi:hypothetical protein Salat_2751500 [Sesamum alatum]|uniref:Uncharacterized protein n=1 Tax=Sesamum alatum TaxID=300844 RepID=A0AAE2C8W1_9LAMI|nr:hypothetical protein Salat_2751500 [Sesamum alatum]